MDKRRRTIIALAVGAVALAVVFTGVALATDRPQFCRTCHEMRPYSDGWADGAHARVWCIDCHVGKGIPARFMHKFVALGEVRAHFMDDYLFPRPTAPDIPNERCRRCHPNPPRTIGKFPHYIHMRQGRCSECHISVGHYVSTASLKKEGVFAAGVQPERLGGDIAQVGEGKANLPGHAKVTCSRCHDLKATGCPACHKPPHKDRGECSRCHEPGTAFVFEHPGRGAECGQCHEPPTSGHPDLKGRTCSTCHRRPGESWSFTHPGTGATCSRCHKPPGGHFSGACSACHRSPGRTWAFTHRGNTGEHSYRSFACAKCHPNGFRSSSCTCHGGRPPSDD